jgi:hypothetical protein
MEDKTNAFQVIVNLRSPRRSEQSNSALSVDNQVDNDLQYCNSINFKALEGIFTDRKDRLTEIFRGNFPKTGKSCSLTLEKSVWDYVIAIHNPDYSTNGNKVITPDFAKSFYKKVFRKKVEINPHDTNIHYEQEKRSFSNVFEELDNFGIGKSFKNGGRIIFESDEIFDTGAVAKDFVSLVRNALIYKLVGNLGLKVKQIMSKNGRFIFLLICADKEDLEIIAEKTRYEKHLEISQVDLVSLLPCDKSLRPFHILKSPTDEIKRLYHSVRKFYRSAFNYDKRTEIFSFDYPSTDVSPEEWSLYTNFLELVSSGIKAIKSSVKSKVKRMVLFQKLIKESLTKVNSESRSKHKLKNLWDWLGLQKEIPPYLEYKKFSKNTELQKIWRYYSVDANGKRALFKNMERIRLLSLYIEQVVDLSVLEHHNIVAGHFPLHHDWELNGKTKSLSRYSAEEDHLMHNFLFSLKENSKKNLPLEKAWRVSLINNQLPLSKLRNYFGEKIAMYFEFLNLMHKYLLFPSILGIIVFILQHYIGDNSNTVVRVFNIFYSILMTLWATIFTEHWKQREASLAILWGQTKYEQIELPRGRFHGHTRRSPITDDFDEVHFDQSKRLKYYLLSISVTIFLILLVLSFVASFLVLKNTYKHIYIYYLSSLGNALQIQLFNFIYSRLAIILTEKENHRTRVNYEDSLIVKTFCFQFVNSFNSLFYIAFIKPGLGGCNVIGDGKGESCMHELFIQLLLIFLVSYFKNLLELGTPLGKYYFRKYLSSRGQRRPEDESLEKDLRTEIESELNKDYYLNRDFDGTIQDYLELAIQFSLLTLFAIAFPMSTVLAFIGLWLEMFTDKFKILNLVKRPVPLQAKDVGTWGTIFNAISILSIFTNSALFCFTAEAFKDSENSVKFIVYGVVVVVLLVFRAQLQWWIPDILPKYEIISARHEYVISKFMQVDKVEKIEEEVEAYDRNIYFTKTRFI